MGEIKQPPPLPLTDDRRAHRRHGVMINVRMKDEKGLRDLYATDLSRGGLFLASKTAMPVGQKVVALLVHPLSGDTLELKCQVANVRRDEQGAVRGCGLKFVKFTDELRDSLSTFVQGVVDVSFDDDEAEAGSDERAVRAKAMLDRGLVLAQEGNLVGAAHVLSRATTIDPTAEDVWSALREVEAKLQATTTAASPEGARDEEPEDLTDELEELIEDDDGWDEPDVDWDEPVVEVEEPSAPESVGRRKAKLLCEAARDCYGTGDVADAIAYLEKAIGTDPTHAAAFCALAGILAEQGDAERGITLCKQAIELEPTNDRWLTALSFVASKRPNA